MNLSQMETFIRAFDDLTPKSRATLLRLMDGCSAADEDKAALNEIKVGFFPRVVSQMDRQNDRVLQYGLANIYAAIEAATVL